LRERRLSLQAEPTMTIPKRMFRAIRRRAAQKSVDPPHPSSEIRPHPQLDKSEEGVNDQKEDDEGPQMGVREPQVLLRGGRDHISRNSHRRYGQGRPRDSQDPVLLQPARALPPGDGHPPDEEEEREDGERSMIRREPRDLAG